MECGTHFGVLPYFVSLDHQNLPNFADGLDFNIRIVLKYLAKFGEEYIHASGRKVIVLRVPATA